MGTLPNKFLRPTKNEFEILSAATQRKNQESCQAQQWADQSMIPSAWEIPSKKKSQALSHPIGKTPGKKDPGPIAWDFRLLKLDG
jgi:hypothetical protein